MTKGGPALSTETQNLYGYTVAFTNFDISYAMTIALFLTIVPNIALLILNRFAMPKGFADGPEDLLLSRPRADPLRHAVPALLGGHDVPQDIARCLRHAAGLAVLSDARELRKGPNESGVS